MASRDITHDAIAASQQQHGIAHAQCIEATFGAKVISSLVAVTYVGPRSGFRLETSIDGGRTWDEIHGNVSDIPRLSPGTAIVHAEIMTRVLFIDHADTVLIDQIITSVTLNTGSEGGPGTPVIRTESGATLGSGSLIGCKYDPMRDGLAAVPEVSVEFSDTASLAHGVAWYTPHAPDEQPQGMHISHGRPDELSEGQGSGSERPYEMQDIANPDHLKDASCTIEIWVFPTKYDFPVGLFGTTHHTILSWLVDMDGNGEGPHGCALQLIPDTQFEDGLHARARFVRYGYVNDVEDIEVLSTTRVRLNQWTRIVLAYDGFRAKIIINDAVSNSVAMRALPRELINAPDVNNHYGIVIPTTGKFYLGHDPLGARQEDKGQFHGRLSELRLYNREATLGTGYLKGRRRLSNLDIASLQVTDGLAEYWPLNEGAGTIAFGKIRGIGIVFNKMHDPLGSNWIPSYDTFLGRLYELTVQESTRAEESGGEAPEGLGDVNTVVIDMRYAPARISTPMVVEAVANVVRITNAPFRVIFPDGRPFEGVGQYAGIDAIQEPTEIGSTGINASLTALDESLVAVAMQAVYLDGSFKVYEVYFDEEDQLIQDPVLVFGGLMDAINIRGGKEPTVVVSAESQLRNWQRSSVIKWNDQGHRARFPHDLGLEFVGRTVDQIVWWPAKTTENF